MAPHPAVCNLFLDFSQKAHAPRTYEFYRGVCRGHPSSLYILEPTDEGMGPGGERGRFP